MKKKWCVWLKLICWEMYAPEIYGLAVRKYCWIEWELLFQTDARTCILNTDRSPLVESIVVFSLCTTFSSFFSHSCKLWPTPVIQRVHLIVFLFLTFCSKQRSSSLFLWHISECWRQLVIHHYCHLCLRDLPCLLISSMLIFLVISWLHCRHC